MYIDLIRPGIFCYGRCYQFSWGRGNELTTSLPCPSKKCTFRKFAYKIPLYKITIQSLYRAILLVLEVSRCSCISCCEEHREAKWRILTQILLLMHTRQERELTPSFRVTGTGYLYVCKCVIFLERWQWWWCNRALIR